MANATSVTASPSRVVLGLADDVGEPLATAPWIGSLISLGSRLRRYLPKLDGRQLVLAISVPRRDYAAALIGAGWMLCSPVPNLQKPIETFRLADRTKFLRAVTEKIIVTGSFTNLVESRADPRVLTGGKLLPVARYRAVVELDQATPNIVNEVPDPGFLAEFTGAADHWLERLAAPPMDLALVGTAKWLRDDLEAIIGDGAAGDSAGAQLHTYVLPYGEGAATWSTPIISSARLGEGGKLPGSCTAVILDRYAAIKHLNDITVPIVVCVIDRSVADESAAETVLEARLSNSRPISVAAHLRWSPPPPIEALGFTVSL